uniref:F-box protein 16 n=1 Tax=Salarias fasciatus TaxID=181472 RepID=A0A672JNG8_SALFA
MPTAARTANCSRTGTKLSCWTPLNHPQTNSKVFDRWTDGQRKAVLQDLVQSCSVGQLSFLSLSLSGRLPLQAADFACLLPRALCLYVFSFLDPRSLSRCAQVSWHWRSMVDLDQLWMRKCLKLGWCVHPCPTAFEQGVWKRRYIQGVQELKLSRLQQGRIPAVSRRQEADATAFGGGGSPASTPQTAGRRSGSGLKTEKQPPWRDSDRHPKDTVRFNYLDNLDPPPEDRTG